MPSQHIPQPADSQLVETRIEDGKLLYERRWYLQFVFLLVVLLYTPKPDFSNEEKNPLIEFHRQVSPWSTCLCRR